MEFGRTPREGAPTGYDKSPGTQVPGRICCRLLSNVGQQSDLASTLDGADQVTLVSCAGTGGTAGQDLAALGQVTAKLCGILVIDAGHLVHAECTNLLALAGTDTLFVSHGNYLLVRVEKFRRISDQKGSCASSSASIAKSEAMLDLAYHISTINQVYLLKDLLRDQRFRAAVNTTFSQMYAAEADGSAGATVASRLGSAGDYSANTTPEWVRVHQSQDKANAQTYSAHSKNTLAKPQADGYTTREAKLDSLSLRFLSNRDGIYKNMENVPPLEGYEDVAVHADPYSFGFVDPQTGETVQSTDARFLANRLRESGKYNGGPIRLIACESGKVDDGIAQALANELGVPVLAPTKTVYIDSQGYMVLADNLDEALELMSNAEKAWNSDGWKVFAPRKE